VIRAPGPHGGDGAAVAASLGLDPSDVVDLSMSLNPFAPPIKALAARHLDALGRYPDVTLATSVAAAALGVDPGRLCLTNGGSEAIALVAATLGGSVVAEPEFSLHPRGAGGPRWRSNPHNPSGALAAADEGADVWDEAFYPLATGTWTRGDPGAVVVGSFTKVFACPGLRIGYVLADDVERHVADQPAWPLNGLALAVLPELLATADLAGWHAALVRRRGEVADVLTAHDLVVHAADAPWVLVEAPALRDRLAPHGVIVRDCASFGMPGTFRVGLPDARGLEQLASALTRSSP
jgi:histidinol-phosphate/aromatic aminotransferase/cobyric acid decarboxylase-like protein